MIEEAGWIMAESVIQLEYAKRPRWHRRRAFGWMVVGIALLAVAGSAWRWGPEKWQRGKLLYWQWRCMHYSPGADEIVFDQQPWAKSPLLAASTKYVPQAEYDLRVSRAGITTAAAEAEPGWEVSFAKIMGMGGWGRQAPVVFMHDRASRAGRHYLVILRGDDIPFLEIAGLPLDIDAFAPGNWRDDPAPARGGRFWSGPVEIPAGEQIRIYAGQADPADQTHFTIRYVENGVARIMDGYVDDFPYPSLGGLTLPGVSGFIAEVKLIPRRPN